MSDKPCPSDQLDRESDQRWSFDVTTSLDDLPALVTPPGLARLMRTTTHCLAQDRYLGRGVPYVRAGRRILYRASDIREYLDRNTETLGGLD
jgi:hypothetical protein